MAEHDPFQPPPLPNRENPYAPPEGEIDTGVPLYPLKPGSFPFTIGDVVNRTWELYKARFGLVFGLAMIPIGISFVYQFAFSFLLQTIDQRSPMGILANMMFSLAGAVLQMWLAAGTSLALIKVARNEPAEINDLFRGGPYVVRILLASLLYGLVFVGLTLCFLVPAGILAWAGNQSGAMVLFIIGILLVIAMALFVGARLAQFTYLIIDRDAGVFQSLQWSYEITRGHVSEIIGLFLIAFAAALLGLLACLVGYLFAIPWIMLLMACTYVALISERPVGFTYEKFDEGGDEVYLR